MLHIQLMLAGFLSLACTANLSAADMQKTDGTTKKTRPKPQGATPATDLKRISVTTSNTKGKTQAAAPAADLNKKSRTSKKNRAQTQATTSAADLSKAANAVKKNRLSTIATPLSAAPPLPDVTTTAPDSGVPATGAPNTPSFQDQAIARPMDTRRSKIAKKNPSQNGATLIDEIIAVINNDAITRHELEDRMDSVERQLTKQGTPLPDLALLEKQILERMITEMLQIQFAKETGIRIDDVQLDKTLQRIAKDNKFPSLDEFRTQLEKDGVNFKKFREEIRGEIISARLREREVDSKLVISDGEVENFLANQAKQAGKGEEFHLAHILIMVPEQASPEKIQAIRARAEQALTQLRDGAEFAQVAAGFSDAKDALEGGNLGWRSTDRTPAIFLNVLQKMASGEISPVFRSPNGFHILKLIEKRSKDSPIVISQTHTRHILVKTSELVPENEARNRLTVIKQRIEKGADFSKEAKLYSEDGSAAQGGDLGWISPGDTVPEFEDAMNQLEPGQMSGLVQSTFGWHLIQVLERRSTDVSVKQKKQQAQLAIRSYKSDAAYQDWLRQLRDSATIENRLEQANP